MRLPNNPSARSSTPRALARAERRRLTEVGPLLAVRAARAGVARMRQAMDRAVSHSPQTLFLRALVAQPGTVGAICASSPRLAQRMAAQVDLARGGLVVELGGGTGVISAALLAHGVPAARLVIVEQSPALAAHLRRRFPGVCVIEGDAAELTQWHADGRFPAGEGGALLPIDCIVSGLPLLSIPLPVRQRILYAGAQALAPGGKLVQFTYALHGPSPWQGAGLVRQRNERVLANLPPARIDVLGHPPAA
ncbi:MAG: methyltransferase [Pseudomonadota bacterium]|nr:methyltransferase [Pseudomonadota bacterium]